MIDVGIENVPLYSASAWKVRYRHAAFYAAVLFPAVVITILRDDGLFQAIMVSSFVMLAFVLPFLVYPRRLELWGDSVQVTHLIGRWTIAYSEIESIRKGRWWESRIPGQSLVVYRKQHDFFSKRSFNLYPDDEDEFLRELERAMRRSSTSESQP